MATVAEVFKSKFAERRIKEVNSYIASATSMISRSELDMQSVINASTQLRQALSELEQLRGAAEFAHTEGKY